MQSIIEDVIQGLGWSLLKLISLGTYKSSGTHARLFEGSVGLLAVVTISWTIYHWGLSG
jgi:hypothetical protein